MTVHGTGEGGWPVDLRGITESVVATRGPNGRWNLAALGLHASDGGDRGASDDRESLASESAEHITAITWGDTRTRRNFHREGGGVVQFTADPRDFVDAALTIREADDPVLASADAWVEVEVERIGADAADGTRRERWALTPGEATIRREYVPTINRGFNAVIEATVAASRLDVSATDTTTLLARLDHLASVVETCGGPDEREAFARIDAATGRRERRERRNEGH